MLTRREPAAWSASPASEPITPEELLALECDILIPAALENTVHGENAASVKAKIVAEAANGPMTPEADRILESKGVFVIPDILCNAGGVTVSYFEWVQDEQHLFWEAQDVYNRLESVMKTSFNEVLEITWNARSACGRQPTCWASAGWRKPPNCAACIHEAGLRPVDADREEVEATSEWRPPAV